MNSSSLSVQKLRFSYTREGEELFNDLEHTFTAGAVTALTGPSGSGKSTLLYILGLMLTPTKGRVALSGVNVSAASDAARSRTRAHEIGFVFQDAVLDPTRTILDSVTEPAMYIGTRPRDARERGRELLGQVGLGARQNYLPSQISGGQAQRAAVCRALINKPAVVLADEPTGNLDPANAEMVLRALSAIAKGSREPPRTIVIATHDPFVLGRVDEVMAL